MIVCLKGAFVPQLNKKTQMKKVILRACTLEAPMTWLKIGGSISTGVRLIII